MREITLTCLPKLFDLAMATICADPEPFIVHTPGHFFTTCGQEWGAASWRLPSGCRVEGDGGTLEVDVAGFPDAFVDDVPLHMIPSAIDWARGKSGQAAVDAIPTGEAVRNLTLVANHSKLVERFKAKGKSLRLSGAVLQGHEAAIENVGLVDFGAWGHESFPLVITGALNGYDRHALYAAPEGFAFEEAHITGTTMTGYVPLATNDQLTVQMITGGFSSGVIADPWAEVGPWRQIPRKMATIAGFSLSGCGSNLIQAATIYQSLKGLVSRGAAPGCMVFCYGDTFASKGIEISDNDGRGVWCFCRLLLSPTGLDAEHYSHDDYVIQRNQYGSSWFDVDTSELAGDWARSHDGHAAPESRHIRNIVVESAARVTSTSVGVTQFPSPSPAAKGCRFNPFGGRG